MGELAAALSFDFHPPISQRAIDFVTAGALCRLRSHDELFVCKFCFGLLQTWHIHLSWTEPQLQQRFRYWAAMPPKLSSGRNPIQFCIPTQCARRTARSMALGRSVLGGIWAYAFASRSV